MSSISDILSAMSAGDAHATDELLPLVYDELRRLATAKMAQEKPGQTLQPTALVHEAYLRLIGDKEGPQWDNRGHFFAAAAEAMRRILVDRARRKLRPKHGGGRQREPFDNVQLAVELRPEEVISVNDLLDQLVEQDPQAAAIVNLRYFSGYSVEQAAQALGIATRTAYRDWAFARAWLRKQLVESDLPE